MEELKDAEVATARLETVLHIREVQKNINCFVKELLKRAENHDKTKLESPEVELFDKFTKNLAGYTYGTEEYAEQKKRDLQPALDHHYAKNRHHPEHFKNGINDMTLVDLIEMFCDWAASTKRTNEGNLRKSIEFNKERFGINKQLVKIFENTIEVLDR